MFLKSQFFPFLFTICFQSLIYIRTVASFWMIEAVKTVLITFTFKSNWKIKNYLKDYTTISLLPLSYWKQIIFRLLTVFNMIPRKYFSYVFCTLSRNLSVKCENHFFMIIIFGWNWFLRANQSCVGDFFSLLKWRWHFNEIFFFI